MVVNIVDVGWATSKSGCLPISGASGWRVSGFRHGVASCHSCGGGEKVGYLVMGCGLVGGGGGDLGRFGSGWSEREFRSGKRLVGGDLGMVWWWVEGWKFGMEEVMFGRGVI
jgi:hypothetical protein